MAYINKRTTELLSNLTLSLKCAAKNQNKAEHGSSEWHGLWDMAEYNHMAIEAILGDKKAAANLRDHAEVNYVARETIERCAFYGVTI